jgi:hypothetical protein
MKLVAENHALFELLILDDECDGDLLIRATAVRRLPSMTAV